MNDPGRSPLVARLRADTRAAHDAVDAVFGRFRLDTAEGYRAFLLAHARALPAAEAWLAGQDGLPAWRPRAALLAADLADLGEALPEPLAFTAATESALGVLYTVEGSRLGGVLLARGVPADGPVRYLAARHEAGEWRATLGAIAAAEDAAAVVAGALATFDLYARAAR